MLSVVMGLDLSEMPEAAALASRAEESRFGGLPVVAVLGRWAEFDPKAAMEAAMKVASRVIREMGVQAVLLAWVRVDREGALAWQSDQPEGRMKQETLATLLPALVESDPEMALRMAKEAPANLRARVIPAVLMALAQQDPVLAAAETERMGRSAGSHLFVEVAGAWAEKDPEAAQAWARSVKSPEARRLALAQVYGVLARRDPGEAQKRLSEEPDALVRQQGRTAILREVATRNPAELPKHLAAIENPAEMQAAMRAVGLILGAGDREVALKFAKDMPAGEARAQLMSSVAHEWSQTDAAGALAWASSLPAGGEKNRVLQTLVNQWASQDFEAANRYLQELPPGQTRKELTSSLAMQLASQDPGAVGKWLKGLPAAQQGQVAQSVILQVTRHDPAAGLELLGMLPEGGGRNRGMLIGQMIEGWAESDLPGALSWAKEMPDGETKRSALMNLNWRWMESAPKEALDYAVSLPPGRTREQLLGQAANHWGMRDPAGAGAWAAALPEGDTRQRALVAVISAWSANSPTEAATFVAGLPAGKSQVEAALSVAGAWADQAPGEAMAWIAGFADPTVRQQAETRALGSWAAQDAAAAAAYLRAQTPGRARDELVTSTLGSMAQSDPAQAAAMVSLITVDSDQRQNAWSEVAGAWANEDSAAAARWLGGLPAGKDRDAAMHRFVHSAVHNDPSVAATVAAAIADPGQRASALQLVAGLWRATDPEAAARWLGTVQLPESTLPVPPESTAPQAE
jgi:hypothetical protein